ncbi:MAG: hypothetical protein OFPI_29260 [Osedax symbiont Rs2]|nr:MAG: hypothetical protein OFPI_29260 [Osedax symbiont Rs2]
MSVLSTVHKRINYCNGFTVGPYEQQQRLKRVSLDAQLMLAFSRATQQWSVQALEYKPFLRFMIADYLNGLTANNLGTILKKILKDRASGAFVVTYPRETDISPMQQTELSIKLSTAVAHLVGKADHDAMYGHYYARFSVKNSDNSDSYLRQAHRRMELHNDGTYVSERTDFVLMQKLQEQNMCGGESLLLHIDDWGERDKFYQHPMAKQDIIWRAPKSKNVGKKQRHPVFFEEDRQGRPHMLYIDQFAEPENLQQARYLYEMGESLETDPNYVKVTLQEGAMLVVQNHCWLHGRDKFQAHPQLHRELLRQRGHFTD